MRRARKGDARRRKRRRGLGTPPAAGPPGVETRPIAGLPGYRIGRDRSVWSCRVGSGWFAAKFGTAWRRLRPRPGGGPAVMVGLRVGGRLVVRSAEKLHRETFPDPPPPEGTPHARGSEHGRAKLDEAKVAEMRRLRADGWKTPALAGRYGVSVQAVCYALSGRTWRHVAGGIGGGA